MRKWCEPSECQGSWLGFAYIPQAVQPQFMRLVHSMASCGGLLPVSGSDACLFGDYEAVRGLGDETPSMVVAMTGLGLVHPEWNPNDALIRQEFEGGVAARMHQKLVMTEDRSYRGVVGHRPVYAVVSVGTVRLHFDCLSIQGLGTYPTQDEDHRRRSETSVH